MLLSTSCVFSVSHSKESMTYTHTSRLCFSILFFVLFSEQCCSVAAQSIKCMVINLEYVECTWNSNASMMNYTFSSAFKDTALHEDCPEYMLERRYTVGCRIPLIQHGRKFDKLYTQISNGGNYSVTQEFTSLHRYVQLNPPCNLSVVWFEQNKTLDLHWKNSTDLHKNCVLYMVHQQTDTTHREYINVTDTLYSPPFVSPDKRYGFRVRSTVVERCGSSAFWSNWSAWLEWGGAENISRSGWWQVLLGTLPVVLLILLVLLLCSCERLKITLLPIVPDPSKNLQDLFHKHDGNVESWVHISRELKEAFEPDYTEPACDVCEVTAPCDVGPTPVATPTSQTDTCDRPEPAERSSL